MERNAGMLLYPRPAHRIGDLHCRRRRDSIRFGACVLGLELVTGYLGERL
jgi:hypothetical protein